MPAFRDYTGKVVAGLQVIERATWRKGNIPYWKCICQCGAVREVRRDHLERGSLCFSCGGKRGQQKRAADGTAGIKHKMTDTPEYQTWTRMKSRCQNPNNPHYANYGGRGISVCDKWARDFSAFFADVGRRPTEKHSIDRIDNSLGYQPGNVRWATKMEQQNNRRANRWVVFAGERMTVSQAIRASGLSNSTVRNRLHNGWTEDRAFSEPVKRRA